MAPRWTYAEKTFARNHGSYQEYVDWCHDTGHEVRDHQSWKDIRRTRAIERDVIRAAPESIEPQDALHNRVVSESWEKWKDAQVYLGTLGRPVRLAKIADQHHPYADPAAMDLAMQIVRDFNPDVVPSLDDFFDFEAFSTFADGGTKFHERWNSSLENAVAHHGSVMHGWQDAAPNAVFPSLFGNHEKRLWRYLRRNASAVSEYMLGKFVEDLTAQGILFLGERTGHLELSPGLIVLHGFFASKNTNTALKNTLERFGYQRSVLMSHIHRLAALTRAGIDYSVQAVASGCLCELQPHYSDAPQDWQQGIALAYYDPHSRDNAIYNIEFLRSGGYLRAYWNQREYRSKLAGE